MKPMGNTLRGISDALDEFHIVHEVYQLPAEYLKELECPFISVIQNGHFCIVKNMNEKEGRSDYHFQERKILSCAPYLIRCGSCK